MTFALPLAQRAPASRSPRLGRFGTVVVILGLAHLTSLPAAETLPDPKSLPAPKRVLVPKLRGPIQVDGELNEPVWAKAAVLQPFYLSASGGLEREPTAVRIWYDDEALYLGWTCRDTDIQGTFTKHDSPLWDEEVVELFITPKSLTRYFEFEWNPLNTVFDAIINNDLDERGISKAIHLEWDYTARGMTSAVKVKGTLNNASDRDEQWQVEIRLPFADLGQPAPQAGAVWRANFYRYNRTQGRPVEQVGWSPTRLPGFHQPNRFGYLEFGG